jgi:DNA invertase Pin-like site-specific DNA recombinase
MTPAMRIPVLVYLRVSTGKQGDSGLGLDDQLARVKAEAAHRRWRIAHVYQDVGTGRTMARRPQLHEAIAALEDRSSNGHRPRILMVSNLDRLTRSPIDAGHIFQRALDNDWSVVALDLAIDTTTATGELMANVIIAMARWESRRISERTVAGMRQKRARGEHVGRVKGTREIPADILERMRSERQAGATYQAIADGLTADGVKTARGGKWAMQTVRQALS